MGLFDRLEKAIDRLLELDPVDTSARIVDRTTDLAERAGAAAVDLPEKALDKFDKLLDRLTR